MSEKGPDTLPHVLSGYNSDYIPEVTPSSQTRPSQHSSRAEQSPSRHDNQSRSQGRSGHKCHRSPARSPVKSAASTQSKSASRRSKKSDSERYEELSQKWDQAKQEVRQEDHELLRQKVALQQELIRKQAEYGEQRRLQQEADEQEKREAEKAKKQAKQDELQQICKQSLESDRKQQREERKAKLKMTRDEGAPLTSTPGSLPSSPAKSPVTPTTPGGSRRINPFKSTLPAVAPTPELMDEDSEEEEEEQLPKDVPWHEQQLYRLYGKNADYFLHPKIENKSQIKKNNPKLRRQGGRVGADVLWQTLRKDSQLRLLQEDASIPDDLKAAYGAFARQTLKKSHVPVQRMFCPEEDLPEMPRLLDNRKLYAVRKMRHKIDIMYRASTSNQDRTNVLTFNNPLPEFNEGAESVSEYLPSWQDHLSESTAPDYIRWLTARGRQVRENTIQEEDGDDDDWDENGEPRKPVEMSQSMDENMLMFMSRRRQAPQKQKFVFLSERDTTVKGQFSDKYKGEREHKDIPRPYQGDLPKSYSALGGMISATPDVAKSTPSLRYSAPLPRREDMMRRFSSTWQPLSMTALVEYKKQVSTQGEGDFNHGRTKMWSHIPVI